MVSYDLLPEPEGALPLVVRRHIVGDFPIIPHSLVHIAAIIQVILAQDWLESLCSLHTYANSTEPWFPRSNVIPVIFLQQGSYHAIAHSIDVCPFEEAQMVGKERAEGALYLLCVVVGHVGEKVMRHMSVGNVVEEIVQEAVGSVHSRQGALEPVPLLVVVMRQLWVSVLQERDHYQPVVDHQVRDNVHLLQNGQS